MKTIIILSSAIAKKMISAKPNITCESLIDGKLSLFQRLVVGWYAHNGRSFPWRKKSLSNYQMIIAELLLQRTKAENVAAFFPAFIRAYPNWAALAKASEVELQQFLKPIGLWRRRAFSLTKLAQQMSKRRGRLPHERAEVENLPSIGQYIANAIMLHCFNVPEPLLDAGMARVLERVFEKRKKVDIRYDTYLQKLAHDVVALTNPQIINWAILDLAALICRPKHPKCPKCPVNKICRYANSL